MARRSWQIPLLALALAGSAGAEGLYLFVVPTTSAATLAPDFSGPLRVAAHVEDPAALARALGAPAPEPGADRLELILDAYPQLPVAAGHDDTAASWVIDYQDPAVANARALLVAEHGEHPTRQQLVDFVDGFVDEASSVRGFDFASRVARDRKGDCTEHAVLLAALGRSVGLRTRVALGVALVLEQGRAQTFGHAWAELREGDRWVVADAALNRAQLRVRYLPYGVLTDESPSYAFGLVSLTPVWLKRLEVLGPAQPAPAR